MKVLTVFFAFAASTVQADQCLTASSGEHRMKTVLTNQYCGGATLTCTSASGGCGCQSCCEAVPNICNTARSSGSACTGDFFVDRAKDTVAIAADKSNFQANCCTAKKTCDITCTAGFTDKTDKATTKCSTGTCSELECCDITPGTCGKLMSSGTGSCTSDQRFANAGTTATAATYAANCCVAKKTCDVTCPAGYVDKTGKATIKCSSGTCSKSECCDADSTKCQGQAAAGCNANDFVNPATAGSAATASTYKTACCLAKATCAAFSSYTPPVASLAKTTQAPPVAFLLTFGGALVFGQ